MTEHFSFLSGKEARWAKERETRKVGLGGLVKKTGGINRLGERRTWGRLGKGQRGADQRKGPPQREVRAVDVNGA